MCTSMNVASDTFDDVDNEVSLDKRRNVKSMQNESSFAEFNGPALQHDSYIPTTKSLQYV
jgi:hypothetical protein